MRAVGRALRGISSVAALLLLLVGVPALLAGAVGWPLPHAVPAWEQITGTFRGDLPLDADTVWKVLACVVWVAWAQIFAATAIEAMAMARGGVAAPIRGLAHMQGLAGSLLGTAVLLLPGTFAQAPAHESPSIAAARTLVAHTAIPASSSAEAYDDDVPAPPETATIEHTVVRRDTLWDLAERYVAPGGSVDEVSSAVRRLFELNQGRPQADGSALTDASLLRLGWVLRIPVSTPPPPGAPAVAVTPGDSLWEIAEEHLGDGHRYREVFDLNVGRPQPDGDTLTDPSLIEPGWTLELPGTPAPPAAPAPAPPAAPAAPPVPPPPAPPPTTLPAASQHEGPVSTQPPTTADGNSEDRSDTEPADDQASTPLSPLGIAGGLLATGLAAAVTVRRRRQRMRRTPGTELPPVPDRAAGVVDAIVEEDLDVALGVDHALRGLGRALASHDLLPVPVVATVSANQLELLLDRECPEPPEGWHALAAGRGRIWQTKLDASFDDPGVGPAWLPTLVSIGALDADGLLLNLEAVGAVGLVGDAGACAALARSMTVELALTPLADVPVVHVVDGIVGEVRSLPNVAVHPDLATATDAAIETAAAISGALAGADTDTAAELRCRAPEEAWVPAVVVARATDTDDEHQRELVERCAERAGVIAVFVDGCPAGALELTVTPETLSIPALDLHCSAQQLDGPTVEVITELLDAADEVAVKPVVDEPLTLFTPTELGLDDDAGPRLHLRLLGPMTAEGVDLGPQQLAILAYLALHGDVTADALRDAVWGGKTPTRERFLNTIHELRRVVGADVLPTSTEGRYRLRGAWSDTADAERLAAAAAEDAENAAVHLRAVLELVSGPPLTYGSRHRRHFRWVDLGNHASRWERIIGDVAHDLASIALRDDDADLARWAAERGLVACPGNETLTRDLVSAYLAAGEHKTAERVVDEYARALEDAGDTEPPDALYELLESRRAS